MKKIGRGIASMATALFVIVGAGSCGDDGPGKLPDGPTTDMPPASAMLVLDRSSATFGSITIGTVSPPTTFTITNTGGVASGTLAAALTGTDASSFAIGTNGCTGTLAPSASCTIEVTFAPTTVGAKTTSLTIVGTPGGMVSASLDGTGLGLGALTISSNLSALGNVLVGQTGTTVATFTVTNSGTATTGSLSVIPAGSDPQNFAKSNDTCAGMTLAAAASCTFDVRFAPTSAGVKSALFQVNAAPGGLVSGAISGTALAPASLRAVPLQLEFGSVVVGRPSSNLTVTIANLGGVPSGMLTQTVTPSAEFSIASSTCAGTALAASTTCTVTLTFTPTATGARSALLTVVGAPGGSVTTSLVGDGTDATGLSISPSARAFPNTNVGQVAAAQVFTVTNNGASATGPLTASLGGASSQFQVIAGADSCTGNTLAPAASCAISVAFAPTAGGVAHGTLTVAGVPGGAVTASLLGAGVSTANLVIAPPSQGFGSVATGSMSPPLAFTVTNTGGQPSGVPTSTLTGTSASQFAIAGSTCTATIAPGASCTIQVRFAPTTTGAATAALSVTATPGGTVMGTLTGDGIAAGGLLILPSNTTFPVTSIGDTSAVQTLTVLNMGTATSGTVAVSATGEFATTNTCATLAAGATCTISVTFAPTQTGLRTGTVTATASPGGTATAALAGTGRPRLEIISLNSGPVVDPANLGTAIINNTTPHDVQILVRNNTSTSKTLGVTNAFGSPAQYSVVLNTCGSNNTIGADGGLCTIGVRFAPTTTGTKTGSITFDIGSGAQNQATQNLTGVGINSLTITALAGTDFGSVPINITPGALTFRVTNPAGSQTSGTITAALAGGPAFAISADACTGQTLAAGASCLVSVTFSPTTVAAAMTTLTASATPGGMPFINITGNGVSPTGNPPTDITLSPSSVAEGTPVGSTVGTLSTVDADATDTFTYAFVGGTGSTDNAAFTINGAMVQTAGVLDFETKASYAVRVRVTDSGGNIFEKALTIDVTNVDELPVAVDDTATVTEDDPATAIDVLTNDTDIDGGPKMIASVTQPANGTVVITGGGSGLTYRPAMDFSGGDTFTYTLNGGSLATVTVTVTAVDDAPVAVNDTFMVNEDSTANPLALFNNDTDVDSGPIAVATTTMPAHGTVVITPTGVTYTPTANYTGPDTFSYTLTPGSSTATVTITVVPVDDPPVAVTDNITTNEDTGIGFDPRANDTDIDGGPMTIMSFTQPMNGTVTSIPTGVTYTPNANYFGPDSFTYTLNGGSTATVNVTVTPVNDVPSFTKGANQTVLEDATAVTVAGWATMISKGPANESTQAVDFIITTSNDALFSALPVVAADGTLTFTPAANANGSATVTISIHDDGGTMNGGVDTSATQTFTIDVTAVNDVPSFTKGADQTVDQDSGLKTVLAWATNLQKGPADEASQALSFVVTNDNNALFSGQPAVSSGGTLTFTPAAGAHGLATVTVAIKDNGGTANGGVDTSATQTFTIKVIGNQVITFTSPAPTPGVYNTTYTVTATGGGSGNPVVFTIASGSCTSTGTNGSTITFTAGTGSCVINANQAGNADWNAAPQAQQTVTLGKANQTITFTQPTSPVTFSVPSGTASLTATASSGLTVTFSSTTMSVCTVSGTTVTYLAAGTCTLAADQGGDGNYNAAPQATRSVTVSKADQTITFTQPTSPVTFNDMAALTATSSAGLTVTFSSLTTSVCTVSGTMVFYTGSAGLCTIAANQAGNANYNAAPQVTRDVTVNKADQTISFTQPTSPVTFTVPNGTASLSATATSGLTVTFTSTTTSVCTVAGTTVTYIAAGTCTLAADQAGNGNYNAAPQVTRSVTVNKADQTITFTQPTTPVTYMSPNGTASLTATASSGLTVTFTSTTTSVCTVSGTTVTYIAAGTCTLAADQAGNGNYNAAPQVTRSVTVNKANQTITFAGPSTPVTFSVPNGTDTLSATASSGLTVAFSSTTMSVCTVSGTTVTYVAAGTCTIAADQPGDTNWNAAPQVTRNVVVGKADQTISFTQPTTPVTFSVPNGTDTLSATASSGLTVTFSSTTMSVCTVSGTTVTYVAAGTCTLTADQGGNANYNAAPQVTRTVAVGKADQTISFTQPTTPVTFSVPNGTATLSATSSSGLTVTFSSTTMSVCTVSGVTVTYIAAGTCTLAADQGGNANYNAAPQVTHDVIVDKADQTITFGGPTTPVTYMSPNGTAALSATASSGLTVTFSSTTTSVCTVSGTTVTYIAAGTCTLAADQGGNANYNAAPQVTRNVVVNPADQTITFGGPSTPVTYMSPNGTAALSATASSGLTVTFSSMTTLVCTVSGTTVTYIAAGTCTLAADQGGNANYNAAPQVTRNVLVNKASQTITFAGPSTPVTFAVPNGTAPLSATASSTLTVTFTSTTMSICTVSGTTVTYIAAGTCTIAADQGGDSNYNAAPQVTRNVVVNQADQTISFTSTAPASPQVGGTYVPTATATSGLTVTFSSLTTSVCTVSSGTVTFIAGGTCTVAANQGGNTNYNAAPQVTQAMTVNFPPVLANAASISYSLHSAATTVDSAITVTDSNDSNLSSATISVFGGFDSNDVLSLNGGALGGTSVSYVTGVLTITGVTTVANYQTMLKNVQFRGTNSTAARTIRFVVNDGAINSNNLDSTITVSLACNTAVTFTNNTALTITNTALATGTIAVTGLCPKITKVTVSLTGLSHANADDIDMVIDGPGAADSVMFMSDVGGDNSATNINLLIDDSVGAGGMPNSNPLTSGTFKSTNFDSGGDSDPSNNSQVLTFFGTTGTPGGTPNGTWTLRANDDTAGVGNNGTLNSWSITITAAP